MVALQLDRVSATLDVTKPRAVRRGLRRRPASAFVVACVAIVAGGTASLDSARAAVLWKTPQGAAYCAQITDYANEGAYKLTCWTPNDGFTVSMYGWGRPTKRYIRSNRGRHVRRTSFGVLRFGGSWRTEVFRCESQRTGLRCKNDDGHGWWLGRYRGYRLF